MKGRHWNMQDGIAQDFMLRCLSCFVEHFPLKRVKWATVEVQRCLSWNEKGETLSLSATFVTYLFHFVSEVAASEPQAHYIPAGSGSDESFFRLLMFCCVSDHTVLLKCLFYPFYGIWATMCLFGHPDTSKCCHCFISSECNLMSFISSLPNTV